MLGGLFILMTLGLYARWLVLQTERTCDDERLGARAQGNSRERVMVARFVSSAV
jgi:hypothetical protein